MEKRYTYTKFRKIQNCYSNGCSYPYASWTFNVEDSVKVMVFETLDQAIENLKTDSLDQNWKCTPVTECYVPD